MRLHPYTLWFMDGTSIDVRMTNDNFVKLINSFQPQPLVQVDAGVNQPIRKEIEGA